MGERILGAVVAVSAVLATGCLAFDEERCADGRLCPVGSHCDARGRCISQDQVRACNGLADRQDCSIAGAGGTCVDGACELWFCGDETRNGGESCDCGPDAACSDDAAVRAQQLGDTTCLAFGFTNASGLACNPDCTFDTDACTGGCGDGIKDDAELCDCGVEATCSDDPVARAEQLGGADCTTAEFYYPANLGCSPYCTYDVTNCTGKCGDGFVDDGHAELCDGPAPAGESCLDYSFDAGRLGCALCAPGFTGCTRFGWQRVSAPATQELRGIWGAASDDFFIVGRGGTILRYDGLELKPMTSPAREWTAIWGAAANDVFVVGAAGAIAHFDGTSFVEMTSPTSQPLLGVWGAGPTDVFAVGGAGTILHYDGTWSASSPTSADLRAVWGTTASDVYAVGTASTVLRYNGTSWASMSLPSELLGSDLRAIWGTTSSNIYVAGADGAGKPMVIHYNGTTWNRVDPPAAAPGVHAGLWGSGASDAFAVGDRVLHHDGTRWTELLLPAGFRSLRAIWGSPTGDVWAAGDGGYVVRWGGLGWTAQQTPAEPDFRAVWSSAPDHAIAVGFLQGSGKPRIERYDGASWIPEASTATANLFGIWGTGTSFAVAAGGDSVNGVILEHDGTSWTNAGVTSPTRRAVWGTASDDVFVVGDTDGAGRNAVSHLGTTGWSNMPFQAPTSPLTLLRAVWGSSSSDVYAGGQRGSAAVLYHYNGSSWAELALPAPAVTTINGMWGTGPADVFAVGDAILHHDGVTWSHMSAPGQALRAVSGTGPRNVFAVGDTGRLLHYDGIGWTPIRVPAAPLTPILYGVAATSRSVIVAGEDGFVQRLSFSIRPEICDNAWDDDGDGSPDCADAACATDPYCTRGGACPYVEEIACNAAPTVGSTIRRTPSRDYYSCSDEPHSGPEAFYRFAPATSGTVTVTLSKQDVARLSLVVVGAMDDTPACDPDFKCLDASSTAGSVETVSFVATAGRPYYIAVDGRGGDAGPFTLAVTCP